MGRLFSEDFPNNGAIIRVKKVLTRRAFFMDNWLRCNRLSKGRAIACSVSIFECKGTDEKKRICKEYC